MNGKTVTVMEAALRGANGSMGEPRIVSTPVRDAAYEAKIDSLIDEATRLANVEVGDELTAPPHVWSRAFHTHVDLLAHARGLRTASWIIEGGVKA